MRNISELTRDELSKVAVHMASAAVDAAEKYGFAGSAGRFNLYTAVQEAVYLAQAGLSGNKRIVGDWIVDERGMYPQGKQGYYIRYEDLSEEDWNTVLEQKTFPVRGFEAAKKYCLVMNEIANM